MSMTATEALERVAAEQAADNDSVERAIEEGRKPTREEVYAWLGQFTYEQKLQLRDFLPALHAEREEAKEKAS